ncbi:hypothetical protein PGIGA_G00209670 [Pangasianodon gigas]|uniref:Uncharacterized protein n=1 Tax=Pangasianodon gigas TaxID=30993 RepID=A0ACC5WFY6_PANGG|nr:hypothetical protein [Pangasianodon gigas]
MQCALALFCLFKRIQVTLASLFSASAFSHPPQETGSLLGTVKEDLDIILRVFASYGTALALLGDFNLPTDKLQSSCPSLGLFDLTNKLRTNKEKWRKLLDLVVSGPPSALDLNSTFHMALLHKTPLTSPTEQSPDS